MQHLRASRDSRQSSQCLRNNWQGIVTSRIAASASTAMSTLIGHLANINLSDVTNSADGVPPSERSAILKFRLRHPARCYEIGGARKNIRPVICAIANSSIDQRFISDVDIWGHTPASDAGHLVAQTRDAQKSLLASSHSLQITKSENSNYFITQRCSEVCTCFDSAACKPARVISSRLSNYARSFGREKPLVAEYVPNYRGDFVTRILRLDNWRHYLYIRTTG